MYKIYKDGDFIGWAIGHHYTAQKTTTGYYVYDPTGRSTKTTNVKTLKDARLWVISLWANKEVCNHD